MKKTGNHDLNVMAGVSAEQAKQKIVKLAGTGFPNDYIKTLSAATSFKVIDDNGNKLTSTEKIPAHNLLSFLGRINYAFKDRYLVSAAIRADGDSYFGSNNKWGYFPSVSVGWRVSEENFMKNVQAISALKLRGSFGATGDNSLSANATTNLLYSALYSFGEGTGTAAPGLANISSLIGNPIWAGPKSRNSISEWIWACSRIVSTSSSTTTIRPRATCSSCARLPQSQDTRSTGPTRARYATKVSN